ncbi:MAG: hypothetical protein M1840_007142 [Geoglossum simile]|nr:MAG: hypothetical protein M1840_007142 [Geoglossum simile]
MSSGEGPFNGSPPSVESGEGQPGSHTDGYATTFIFVIKSWMQMKAAVEENSINILGRSCDGKDFKTLLLLSLICLMSPEERRWAPRSTVRNTQDITTSRSYNSTNWRANADQGVREHRTNASVPSHDENDSLALQAIAEGRRLYIGNMPYMAKSNDVEVLFIGSGYKMYVLFNHIATYVAHSSSPGRERIDISIDPFTGRNSSYCFVELATKEEADRAMLELNGKELLGRPVNIRPGIAKSTRNRPHGRMDIFAQNEKKQSSYIFDRWGETEAQRRGYSYKGHRLYVGGLPRMPDQPTVNELIRNFFQGFTMYIHPEHPFPFCFRLQTNLLLSLSSDAVSKIISPHPSKRSQPGDHYYLFVDFPTAEEADAAVKTLNGRTLPWGGRAIISKARGESRKLDERDIWEES